MPYFVFQLSKTSATPDSVTLLNTFGVYRDARNFAREERRSHPEAADESVRVVFAESPELAENLLRQPREAPILREWEK